MSNDSLKTYIFLRLFDVSNFFYINIRYVEFRL